MMYPPAHYQSDNTALLNTLVAEFPLATVMFQQDNSGWPHISHLPFIWHDGKLLGHLSRAHPLALELNRQETTIKLIFNGPDGYISPNYSQQEQKVPTWNYAKLVVDGSAKSVSEPQEKIALMTVISDHFEHQLAQQFATQPWLMSALSTPNLSAMLNAISVFTIEVTALHGHLKLSQNKSAVTVAEIREQLTQHQQPALARIIKMAQD